MSHTKFYTLDSAYGPRPIQIFPLKAKVIKFKDYTGQFYQRHLRKYSRILLIFLYRLQTFSIFYRHKLFLGSVMPMQIHKFLIAVSNP